MDTTRRIFRRVRPWRGAAAACMAAGITLIGFTACGGSGSGSSAPVVPPSSGGSFTLGGSVSGLTGAGLVVGVASNSISISANATNFVLPGALASGSSYAIEVLQEPAGLTCEVTNGVGIVHNADITNVQVTCGSGWVWVAGAEGVPAQPGANVATYGVRGAPDPHNAPGGRVQSVSWTDPAGNLWLFGGYGVGAASTSNPNGTVGYFNDLWRFNPATQQWTWVSGSNLPDDHGSYGVRRVAASNNLPSAREGGFGWTDAAGNLWLFGGEGWGYGTLCTSGSCAPGYAIGFLNDVWKFIVPTQQWVWVSGGNSLDTAKGVYGTIGVPSPDNFPAGRVGATSWIDKQGDVWLYGGEGPSMPDDLWEYSPAANVWTWMGGNDSHQAPVYGTPGSAAATNTPGLRLAAVGWTDAAGSFWLFGGQGVLVAGGETVEFADIWKYDPSQGLWAWVGGPNTAPVATVYGIEGTASPTNQPGGRTGAVGWTDSAGNFWLFGGEATPPGSTDHGLADLWRFDPNSGQWTWISGSNELDVTGSYGTQGVVAPGSFPGARMQASGWSDGQGNLWLFGGIAVLGLTGYLNDLWKIHPP